MKSTACIGVALMSLAWGVLAQQQSQTGWGGAVWVWDQADAHQTPQTNETRFLRRSFTLPAAAVKAELWITADNQYTAYVNGQKLGGDSEWNTVEKYDVAKHLKAGKNVLAIEARNQGGPAGVIARLHITTLPKPPLAKGGNGGVDLFVVTDQQTKITQDAA